MNANKYKGVWTAIITPFKEDESIDWESFEKLVKMQVTAGVTGIVISGTTGESPTLEENEVVSLIKKAKEIVSDKCLIMAGSGTNNTKKSIEKSKKAKEAGADLVLVVNPYYNKPTQEGLYLHFKAIADSIDLPILLYNIKGRTGVNLEIETLKRLLENTKNIVGIKEASGDLEQIKKICDEKFENFVVLSGDDGITFQIMSEYGVEGVVSVASNIVPKMMVLMTNLIQEREIDEAKKINDELEDLFKKLFIETNPIPVKYAAYKMGLCENVYRLPMCHISESNARIVDETLIKLGLI